MPCTTGAVRLQPGSRRDEATQPIMLLFCSGIAVALPSLCGLIAVVLRSSCGRSAVDLPESGHLVAATAAPSTVAVPVALTRFRTSRRRSSRTLAGSLRHDFPCVSASRETLRPAPTSKPNCASIMLGIPFWTAPVLRHAIGWMTRRLSSLGVDGACRIAAAELRQVDCAGNCRHFHSTCCGTGKTDPRPSIGAGFRRRH